MPTYTYRCGNCGETFERVETMAEHEKAKPGCPKCKSKKVARTPSAFIAKTARKS